MALQADRGRTGPQQRGALRWWLALELAALWRVPLLAVLGLLGLWFAFRGLVHLAFLFDAHPFVTFLLAPLVLPFAALPALCFLGCLRFVPWVWRQQTRTAGERTLVAAGAPVAALLLAQMLDLVQINLIRLLGVRLPRLPLDPY